jgi:hypothetical protein
MFKTRLQMMGILVFLKENWLHKKELTAIMTTATA